MCKLYDQIVSWFRRGACLRSLARSLMTHLSSLLGQEMESFSNSKGPQSITKKLRGPQGHHKENIAETAVCTHKFSLATRYPCLNCSVGAESPSKQSYFNLERNYVLYSICDLNYYFSNHFCLSVVLFL